MMTMEAMVGDDDGGESDSEQNGSLFSQTLAHGLHITGGRATPCTG